MIVPRQETRRAAARLLDELPVVDVTLEDPPIEEVIGLVFAGGRAAEPAVGQAVESEAVDV